jgi:hypothetical protein
MRGLGALLALALLPGCLGGGGGAAAHAAFRFPGAQPTRLPTDASIYLQRIRVGYGAYDLATGDGGLWVAVAHGVTRIDPHRGTVSGRVHVANEMEWTNVAAGPGAVWYLSATGSRPVVREIDPARLTVERTYPVAIPGAAALEGVAATRSGACVGALAPKGIDAVCVGPNVRRGSLLVRSEPNRPRLASVPLSADRTAVLLGGTTIRRVDLQSGDTTRPRLPAGDVALIAVDGPRLWAFVTRPHTRAELWGIAGGKVVRRVTLPIEYAVSMAARDGRVWLLTGDAVYAVYAVRPDGVMSRIATVPRRSRGLVATPTALWTAEYQSGTVIEISSR